MKLKQRPEIIYVDCKLLAIEHLGGPLLSHTLEEEGKKSFQFKKNHIEKI